MDTWDPHEPWDAPPYYTELYWPDYDGELVLPLYGNWHDVPGYEEATLRKGHATYCGEITMVDTWRGFLLRPVENMGLTDRTTVIFTTDHGFYFGEHGGLFGKMNSPKSADGTLRPYGEPGSTSAYSPLFEELVHIPLLIKVPGLLPGRFQGLSSVVDVMPTVLDLMGLEIRTLFRAGPLRRGCGTGQHGEGRSWSAAFPSPTPAIRSIPWTTCCAPFRIILSPRSPLEPAVQPRGRRVGALPSALRSGSDPDRDGEQQRHCRRAPSAAGLVHAGDPGAGPSADAPVGTSDLVSWPATGVLIRTNRVVNENTESDIAEASLHDS